MDFYEVVHQRRAIRKYKPDAVPREVLYKILDAANWAPSGMNLQQWEFIVVTNKDAREQVTQVHAYAHMLKQSPVAIVVCADLARSKYPVDFWVQDCSAATENLLLAAANLGLGTCWCGVHPRPERERGFRKLCRLPDHIIPFALIAVGVSAEDKPPADYYDPERVHRETW